MRWGSVSANNEFICVQTYSGLRLRGSDPDGMQYLLATDAASVELGEALIGALCRSRQISIEEYASFFDYEKRKSMYAAWVEYLIQGFGYKSRRALFRDMKTCSVEEVQSTITVTPTHHDKLEGWSGDGISKESCVSVGWDMPRGEIGAAVRLALSRCT